MGWVQILLGLVLPSLWWQHTDLSTCSHFLNVSEKKVYSRTDLHLNPSLSAVVMFSEFIHLFEPCVCKMEIIKSICITLTVK